MKDAEKLLFCQICLTFILTRGRGLNAKPPEDILTFQAISLSPKQLWKHSSAMVKSRIEAYCEIWDLPFNKWKVFLEDGKVPKQKKQSPMSKEIKEDIKLDCDKKLDSSVKEDKLSYKEFCQCPDCRLARQEELNKSPQVRAAEKEIKKE